MLYINFVFWVTINCYLYRHRDWAKSCRRYCRISGSESRGTNRL